MKKYTSTLIILLCLSCVAHAELVLQGVIANKTTQNPIEYVNIGIAGKNIGTVTNQLGEFQLSIPSTSSSDTILISCIGYKPMTISVQEAAKRKTFFIEEQTYALNTIEIKPIKTKKRVFGVTTDNKLIQTGFTDNTKGYECGLIMKNNKQAWLKQVKINFSYCSYDSIFYRINIYRVNGKYDFENILTQPIYISAAKSEMIDNKLFIDLTPYHITVNGDFLVTLEYVKELGKGGLWFSAGLTQKTYIRKTSQGNWHTAPIAIALSVVADVER